MNKLDISGIIAHGANNVALSEEVLVATNKILDETIIIKNNSITLLDTEDVLAKAIDDSCKALALKLAEGSPTETIETVTAPDGTITVTATKSIDLTPEIDAIAKLIAEHTKEIIKLKDEVIKEQNILLAHIPTLTSWVDLCSKVWQYTVELITEFKYNECTK